MYESSASETSAAFFHCFVCEYITKDWRRTRVVNNPALQSSRKWFQTYPTQGTQHISRTVTWIQNVGSGSSSSSHVHPQRVPTQEMFCFRWNSAFWYQTRKVLFRRVSHRNILGRHRYNWFRSDLEHTNQSITSTWTMPKKHVGWSKATYDISCAVTAVI